MSDEHEFVVEVGEYHPTLGVTCPYDAADEERPCWPYSPDTRPDLEVSA